jgi:hypothetical protein
VMTVARDQRARKPQKSGDPLHTRIYAEIVVEY